MLTDVCVLMSWYFVVEVIILDNSEIFTHAYLLDLEVKICWFTHLPPLD